MVVERQLRESHDHLAYGMSTLATIPAATLDRGLLIGACLRRGCGTGEMFGRIAFSSIAAIAFLNEV